MAYPTPKFGLVAALVIGFAGFVAGGCQKNYDKSLSCSTTADCTKVSGMVTDFQIPAATCCGGFCMVPASGCTATGLRFVTTTGGVGDCSDVPMCGFDMSIPAPTAFDFSMTSNNGDM